MNSFIRLLPWLIFCLISCKNEKNPIIDEEPAPSFLLASDLTYSKGITSGSQDQKLDVYGPSTPNNWPVVIIIHGGFGSRKNDQYVELSNRLAAQNIVVFTISHSGGTPEVLLESNGRQLREVQEQTICAINFAHAEAAIYGGNPNRMIIFGHSAGGFFGCLTAFAGGKIDSLWNQYTSDNNNPSPQVTCINPTPSESIRGFVGFNGAYFLYEILGLAQSNPALWEMIDVRNFISDKDEIAVRFLYGVNDFSTPPEHTSLSEEFIQNLKDNGFNAESYAVEASHDLAFHPNAWEPIYISILEALY